MEGLIDRKKEIIENHNKMIARQNLEILKLTDKAMKDSKFGFNADIGIFEKVKSLFKFESDKVLQMNGDQRLKYSEMWSENAKNMLDTFKNDQGHQSLLKDIENLMQTYKQEIDMLNEELKKADDKERDYLERQKKGLISKV